MKTTLYIFISILLSISVQGQNLQEAYANAARAYSNKEYKQAILEYKRILHFDKQQGSDSVFSKMGNAYFALEEYEQAQFFYSKTESAHRLKKASCYILMQQYEMAASELRQFVPNEFESQIDYYMLQACVALQTNNIDSALAYISHIYELSNNTDIAHIQNDVQHYSKHINKSLVVPHIASAILPGLGLLITGNPREGIRAFVLVGSFATAFVCTAYSYSIFDACIAIGPWLTRYYVGQIKNIDELHKHKSETLRYHIFIQLMNTYQAHEGMQ